MAELSVVEKKIRIQGHGIRITQELKAQLQREGYYPIALTWLGDDITGPFSFAGYGEDSPYELRKIDGGYAVFDKGKFFSDADFYRKPRFFDRTWSNGSADDEVGTVFIDEGMSGVITPCGQEGLIDEQGDILQITRGRFPYLTLACYNGLVAWPSWGCLYTKQNHPCKFCCIPGDYDESKVLINHAGWLDNFADTVAAAVEELGDDIRQCSFTVDAGTLPGRDKGARAYIQVLEAIKKRLGKLPEFYYTRAVIEPPQDDEWLYALRDAGFTDIQMDADVYDTDERKRIMPNAKGYRPIKDYENTFVKAKEIFPGEVASQLIAGIQSDEHLLKGVEHFAALGVPTLVTPFLPFGQGVKLRKELGFQVPSATKMLGIYEKAATILTKYNLGAPEFRGGVSSLPEVMGRRHKRVASLTNKLQAVSSGDESKLLHPRSETSKRCGAVAQI